MYFTSILPKWCTYQQKMKNKMFAYGIPTGLIICTVGFVLIQLNYLTEDSSYFLKNIYKLTFLLGILFLFYESSFVTEKFNLLLKTVSIFLLLLFGLNLMYEFGVLEMKSIDFFSSFVLLAVVGLYSYYFLKKKSKTLQDILKVTFVILSVLALILNSKGLIPNSYKYLTNGLFWVVILGMLFKGSSNILHKKSI